MPQVRKSKRVKGESKRIEEGKGYSHFRDVLEQKGHRVEVKGRRGWVIARRYHLTAEKLSERLKRWHATGVMPSPYTKSVLSDMITALVNLGVNRAHAMHSVMGEMKKIMSESLTKEQEKELGRPNRVRDGRTDWERFEKKERRTENGLSVVGKLIATAMSLRKVDEDTTAWPIGAKLKQMGCCLDFFRVGEKTEDGRVSRCIVYLRLNTHSVEPLKKWVSCVELIPAVNKRATTKGPK